MNVLGNFTEKLSRRDSSTIKEVNVDEGLPNREVSYQTQEKNFARLFCDYSNIAVLET